MIKPIVLMLLIFNLLACKPAPQTSMVNNDVKKPVSFICLKSQNQCELDSEYGHFSIHFSGVAQQSYIKTELPFQIQLSFSGVNSDYQLKSVSSFLEGKTMFMGKVPVFFEKANIPFGNHAENHINNTMIAETLLASCTEEIMTWKLWFQVEILADEGVQQQGFFIEFDSERL